jgi:hypothetical protein
VVAGVGFGARVFEHYPPSDELGANRLRAATVAWAALLGELHAVGLRPYLELEQGDSEGSLRIYCETDDELLLDISINDEGLPDTPPAAVDGEWVVFLQDPGGYLAEVWIDPTVDFATLAIKLRDLIESVTRGAPPPLFGEA